MHSALDPDNLPRDAEMLRKIVVDLAEQLDRSLAEQSLLRELPEAQRNRKSEQLSKEQLALFEAAWQARHPEDKADAGEDDDDFDGEAGAGQKPDETPGRKRGGRQPLARYLTRERIVHDLAESEKHCQSCGKDLRLIAEETSERYDYIPASVSDSGRVPEVRLRLHHQDCNQATATDREEHGGSQFIGASDRGEVGRLPTLHRQEKIWERHGIEISRKTMGGWMAQRAALLDPLY